MSSLNLRPTLGLQQHSKSLCFLSKPGARASHPRSWAASFSFPTLALAAKKQRVPFLGAAVGNEQSRFDPNVLSDNIFAEIIKSVFRDLKSFASFTRKQVKEFQYLEFPSLQSAGKMAILTVALVMLLIIFLATVDSGLSFIAASVLRHIK